MSQIFRALLWVAASLGIAAASIFELIPEAMAQTLIIVVPALMVATITRKPCMLRRRSA